MAVQRRSPAGSHRSCRSRQAPLSALIAALRQRARQLPSLELLLAAAACHSDRRTSVHFPAAQPVSLVGGHGRTRNLGRVRPCPGLQGRRPGPGRQQRAWLRPEWLRRRAAAASRPPAAVRGRHRRSAGRCSQAAWAMPWPCRLRRLCTRPFFCSFRRCAGVAGGAGAVVRGHRGCARQGGAVRAAALRRAQPRQDGGGGQPRASGDRQGVQVGAAPQVLVVAALSPARLKAAAAQRVLGSRGSAPPAGCCPIAALTAASTACWPTTAPANLLTRPHPQLGTRGQRRRQKHAATARAPVPVSV